MNIKQASEQSGVSAPNIRFYEKEGLLTPARRQGNDYRDYTAGDVRTLKLIRMLRMLDVPLPTIKAVLRGEQPLQQALQAQQTVLEQQAAQLARQADEGENEAKKEDGDGDSTLAGQGKARAERPRRGAGEFLPAYHRGPRRRSRFPRWCSYGELLTSPRPARSC